MLISDAFGLGLFLIVGIQIAEDAGKSATVALIMGVITGVAGGALRDLLCGEIPVIFRRSELYASAALIGGMVYLGLGQFEVPSDVAAILGAGMTIFLRLAALKWRWHLPVMAMKKVPD